MKKIILSLMLILSVVCLFGCKNKYDTILPSYYTLLADGTYRAEFSVSRTYNVNGLCLEIPNEYKGMKVTQLGNIFDPDDAVRKIIISKNITKILDFSLQNIEYLKEIKVSSNNKIYSSVDGILYSKNKSELIICPRAIEGRIGFPLRLKTIRSYAFRDVITLVSIQIPKGVKKIGESAFEGCVNLETVQIPKTVIEIGEAAFRNCEKLKKIKFSRACEITKISNSMFSFCDELTEITLPSTIEIIGIQAFVGCKGLKVINFYYDSQLKEIKSTAFYDCYSLEEITLSNTLKSIGDGVFANCEKLNKINYNGTKEQWNEITIGGGNQCLNIDNIIFNN